MSNQSPAGIFAEATRAHQSQQLERAERLYRQVLAQAPDHREAYHRMGLLCSQQQRHAEALEYLQQALALAGPNPIYFNNLGEVWRRQGNLAEAIDYYRQAIGLAPQFAEAHYNLANALKLCDDLNQALEHYSQALRIRPDYINAHYNLGNTLLGLGRFHAAAESYRRAIQLNPRFAEAYNNRGAALREQGDLDAAIESYQQALSLHPRFAEAQRNLSAVLEQQGQIDMARAAGLRALALDPNDHAFRLHIETLCPIIPADNAAIDRYRAGLLATLGRYAERELPFDLSSLHRSGSLPPIALAYQGRDDRPIKERFATLFDRRLPISARRLGAGTPQIGFVVTHGHEGVFLKCMRGVLKHFPVDRFRLTVVCSQQGGEQILRPAITNPAIQYLALPAPIGRAIELLTAARFDVLYYWEVGTDPLNYALPFCRAAPVQCAGWGWPVSTGIPQIDYFVSSALLETAASDAHYSEQLVRLAHLPTYYYRPPIPGQLRPRDYFGLCETEHVYLCAQNLRKVHPDFDQLLAAILRRDPVGLVLLIADKQPQITELLRRRFAAGMPDVVARIRFLPQLPEADYLNLIALSDLVLDTLHYGGGANTTYDCLAAGTPVVTLPTQFQRGRYAYAAYQQIGVYDAIADSPTSYVDIALALGTDWAARADLSARISAACPVLFEDQAAVDELAEFFEQVLERARD